MKAKPNKIHRIWQTDRLHFAIKKQFKRVHKKRITSIEINKIWGDYIEEEIIKPLSIGTVVSINKSSTIWVQATPILEHKRAVTLLKKGLMYKDGRIVEANLNFDSSKYIYKVMYENRLYKHDYQLYFKPNPNISKAVSEGIKQGKLITRFNK